MYAESTACQDCGIHEETLKHVLVCHHSATTQYRDSSLQVFYTSLKAMKTLEPVITTVSTGFAAWISGATRARSHTVGFLGRADAHLLIAFHEQYRNLGWFQLYLGRIYILWAQPVHRYDPSIETEHWASSFIHALWSFTKSMWKHRNSIFHGITIQGKAWQMMQELQQKSRTTIANTKLILP